MKILHYINNLGAGGAEKLLTDILPLMQEQGNEVHLAYCNANVNVEKFENIISKRGVIIHNLDKSFYSPLNILVITKLINKHKFDIVHAHLFPTQYWLAVATLFTNKKTKFVKTEHSVTNERKDIKWLKPIEKWVYGRYDGIINITHQVHDNLSNWLQHENKMVVIKNGVNLDDVRVNATKPSAVDFSSTKFNLMMVGRFDGIFKDQKTIVKALSLLPKNEFSLYFAGDGKAIEDVKNYAKELNIENNVHFLGLRTDVYTLMSHVDLNILSSNKEGLSGVTLESLASKKPFIGSNVEGINNIVPDERFLFTKSDEKDLATKILNIRNKPQVQQEMVHDGNIFVSKFDIKKMVERYLALYNNLQENEG